MSQKSSWTPEQDEFLISARLADQPLTYFDIGKELERSEHSCIGRGWRLGIRFMEEKLGRGGAAKGIYIRPTAKPVKPRIVKTAPAPKKGYKVVNRDGVYKIRAASEKLPKPKKQLPGRIMAQYMWNRF